MTTVVKPSPASKLIQLCREVGANIKYIVQSNNLESIRPPLGNSVITRLIFKPLYGTITCLQWTARIYDKIISIDFNMLIFNATRLTLDILRTGGYDVPESAPIIKSYTGQYPECTEFAKFLKEVSNEHAINADSDPLDFSIYGGTRRTLISIPTELNYEHSSVQITVQSNGVKYSDGYNTLLFATFKIVNDGIYIIRGSVFSTIVSITIEYKAFDLYVIETKQLRVLVNACIRDNLYPYPLLETHDFWDGNVGCYVIRTLENIILYHPSAIKQIIMSEDQIITFNSLRSHKRTVPGTFSVMCAKRDDNYCRLASVYDALLRKEYTIPETYDTLVYGLPQSTFEQIPGTPLEDLVGTSSVVVHDVHTEARCIIGRLFNLREDGGDDDTVPDRYYDYVKELTDIIIPSSLTPFELEHVLSNQPIVKQNKFMAALEKCAYNVGYIYENGSFIKTENYAEVKDPRNISAVDPAHVIQYACYTQRLCEALHDLPCYAFSKSPKEIASHIHELGLFLKESQIGVIETDFSRFDGTQGFFCKYIELCVLRRAFGKDETLEKLHQDIVNADFKTTKNLRYFTMFTRLSGSADTSVFNTLINIYITYISLRETAVEIEDAVGLLCKGIFGGDDGAVPDVGQGPMLEAVTGICGMKIKATLSPDAITFLGRVYPTPTISGDSFQDPIRVLTKLSFSDAKNIDTNTIYLRKMVSYFYTDTDNIIGRWAHNFIQAHPNVAYRLPTSSYYTPFMAELMAYDGYLGSSLLNMEFFNGYPSAIDDEVVIDRMLKIGFDNTDVERFLEHVEAGSIGVVRPREKVMVPEPDQADAKVLPADYVSEPAGVIENPEISIVKEKHKKTNAFYEYNKHMAAYIFNTNYDKLFKDVKFSAGNGPYCAYFEKCNNASCSREHVQFNKFCPEFILTGKCTIPSCELGHYRSQLRFKFHYIKRCGVNVLWNVDHVCTKIACKCAKRKDCVCKGCKCKKTHLGVPVCSEDIHPTCIATHLTTCSKLHVTSNAALGSVPEFDIL